MSARQTGKENPTDDKTEMVSAVNNSAGGTSDYPPEKSRAIYSMITWRLIPLMFICYIIAYLDRINVGFAKLQLQEVLGVDERIFESVYGIGAGLFFIGYFIFEVPSNLIMERVGARFWIARIMILWVIISSCMIFIKDTTSFYILRFLLGVAEAGFYPGMILYLTYWFPDKERVHTVALFATGTVVAGIIGSPVSGALLDLHGLAGLEGWQWLFLLEGIPAILMGIIVIFVLPNRPLDAKWLSPDEKNIFSCGSMKRLFRQKAKLISSWPMPLKAAGYGCCALFTSFLQWEYTDMKCGCHQ